MALWAIMLDRFQHLQSWAAIRLVIMFMQHAFSSLGLIVYDDVHITTGLFLFLYKDVRCLHDLYFAMFLLEITW